jgi:hypothetical protein
VKSSIKRFGRIAEKEIPNAAVTIDSFGKVNNDNGNEPEA